LLPPEFEVRLVDTNVTPCGRRRGLGRPGVRLRHDRAEELLRRGGGLCRARGRVVVAGGPYPTSSHSRSGASTTLSWTRRSSPCRLSCATWSEARRGACTGMLKSPTSPGPGAALRAGKHLVVRDHAVQYSRGCPFEASSATSSRCSAASPAPRPAAVFAGGGGRVRHGLPGFAVCGRRQLRRQQAARARPAAAPGRVAEAARYPYRDHGGQRHPGQDEEMMELMAEAASPWSSSGWKPRRRGPGRSGKSQNLREDILASVAASRSAGWRFPAGSSWFRREGEDIFERQRRFIQSAGIPRPWWGCSCPAQHPLSRRLAARGASWRTARATTPTT